MDEESNLTIFVEFDTIYDTPMTNKHNFLAKAVWRGTALKFWVQARDETQAWHKAWGQVSRMLGGDSCMNVEIIKRAD